MLASQITEFTQDLEPSTTHGSLRTEARSKRREKPFIVTREVFSGVTANAGKAKRRPGPLWTDSTGAGEGKKRKSGNESKIHSRPVLSAYKETETATNLRHGSSL